SSPRRTISVAGTISPASATRVGSSKITATRSILRDDDVTGSASSCWERVASRTTIFPSREALSADARRQFRCSVGGSRLRQVLGVLPQRIAGALQVARVGLHPGSPGLVPHFATDLVQAV